MSESGSRAVVEAARRFYGEGPVPLHAPVMDGREAEYVGETISSTFVSSVGAFVDRFEAEMADLTGAPRAVAVVSGTAALHLSLMEAGAGPGDLVITQSLTFVATCNAIRHCGATPVLVDVDEARLTMSPAALSGWLEENAAREEGGPRTRSGARVAAIVPMHTFGHPADMPAIMAIAEDWGLPVVEDSTEALGSTLGGRHMGTFGAFGTLSFNGNKLITTGGGGMVLTDEASGARVKHVSTTAKAPHPYLYVHDAVGWNYRLPNINAALGCAQLERLEGFLAAKRRLAAAYGEALEGAPLEMVREPGGARSNHWLNAVLCEGRAHRDALLEETNAAGVMTRPIWEPMHSLAINDDCPRGPMEATERLAARVVNLPSSVPPEGRVP